MSSVSSDERKYIAHSYIRKHKNHKRYVETDDGSSSSVSEDASGDNTTSSSSSSESAILRRSDLECPNRPDSFKSEYRHRSRSCSESPRRRYGGRSPDRQHSRHARDRPQASRCIGVFGLNTNTSQHKVRELFSKFGPIERIQMVIDACTHRSRGFCFIYFENLSDARIAKESCSGIEVDQRRIRVDYSITQRPHTPTPGIYMGRPSQFSGRSRDRYGDVSPRSRRRERDSLSPDGSSRYRMRGDRYTEREYRSRFDRHNGGSRYRDERSRSRSADSRRLVKSDRESRY